MLSHSYGLLAINNYINSSDYSSCLPYPNYKVHIYIAIMFKLHTAIVYIIIYTSQFVWEDVVVGLSASSTEKSFNSPVFDLSVFKVSK